MARKDLLSEAIADAKAVKETALANAKLALEEAFTPKLQSMISAKLAEEADEDEDEEMEMDSEGMYSEEEDMDDEMEMDSDEDEMEMDSEEDMEDEMEMDSDEDEMEDEMEMDSDEEDMDETYEGEDMDDEEDLDLESVIAELESEMNEEEDEESSEEDMEEVYEGEDEDEEEIDLDEVINTLREMSEEEEEVNEDEVNEDEVNELEEAYNTIKSLQSTINEVNLLNAKLLYTNKLFRTFDLNEGQKVKVLENFDRTSSVREVKLVFSTIAENLNVAKKKKVVVKEGYASKATKSSAPKKIISEGNDMAARWKKLAGLK